MKKKRCAQGTCPESEKKDCHRSMNQNRSLEKVIKGKKKTLKENNHNDQKDH